MHARANIPSAAVPPSHPTRIGRYEIQRPIGRGGMGNLYLAHDPSTDRQVAIKLLDDSLDSPEFRQRFVNEARALAAVNHPNIVDIYDTGEFEGTPYFVMEYVHGDTLAELIEKRAGGPITQRLKWMAELCAGLAQAHDAGVVHRDIKPANLIVDRHGRLKILDFGIARHTRASSAADLRLTQVHTAIGTPGYMSPEQLDGAEIDRRSDLFSVGAVCYELFAYKEAFPGRNTIEIERNIAKCQPEPLAAISPSLDPELDGIVRKALSKDPRGRYQDAASFARDLDRLRARLEASDEQAPTRVTPRPTPTGRSRVREARAEAAYQRALAAFQKGDIEGTRQAAVEVLADDPTHKDARALLARIEPPVRRPVARTAVPAPSLKGTVTTSIAASEPTMVVTPRDPFRGEPTQVVNPGAPAEATSVWGTPPPVSPDARTIIVAPRGPDDRARAHDATRTNDSTRAGDSTRAIKPPSGLAVQLARVRTSFAQLASSPGELLKGSRGGLLLVGAAVLGVALLVAVAWTLPALFTGASGPVLTIDRPVNGTLVTANGIRCGSGGTECEVTAESGAIVELVAQADDGFVFSGYTGDCTTSGRLSMNGSRRCGALFTPVTVGGPGVSPAVAMQTITISPVPVGGTVEGVDIKCGTTGTACTASYPQGEVAVLKAIADNGYTLMGFLGDCSPTGQVQMSVARTCGARFEEISKLASRPPVPVPTPPGPSGSKPVPSTPVPPSQPPVIVRRDPIAVPPVDPRQRPGVAPQEPPPDITKDSDKKDLPQTPEEFAKDRIKELLAKWCEAYASMSPDEVLRVFPKANRSALEDQLTKSQYRSLQCTVGEIKYKSLDVKAGKAQLEADVTWVFEYSVTKKEEAKQVGTFAVSHPDERTPWFIDSTRFRKK